MSQHKGKGEKTANPLHKPWTKDAGAKNAKPTANRVNRSAAVKAPETKAVQPKAVSAKVLKQNRQEEAKIYGENACRVAFLQRPEALVR